MNNIEFSISKDFVTVVINQEMTRSFKRSSVKQYLFEFKKLHLSQNFFEDFSNLEKRAIKSYLSNLLARKDYLKETLLQKAQSCGFNADFVNDQLEQFEQLGYINDRKFKEKKAILRLKKGYSLSQVSHHLLSNQNEAKNIEKETLQKLINKKRSLLESKDLKLKQKGYRFFLSRGYSIYQINELLTQEEPFL